jgi:16S rRNA (adenine1518-N6/adenine1519-N6)-dimethyltransferase
MTWKSARHGQNFLTDPVYAARIISALPPTGHHVLEVGPGKGILTDGLISSGHPPEHIWAVELDPDLARELGTRLPRLNLHTGDILKTDLAKLAIPHPFQLLSNLPYDISQPFFDRLISWVDQIECAVIMVQKEFAEKICLQPRRAAQGNLLAMLFRIDRLFNLPPGAFRPVPKVHSTVLRLTPLPAPPTIGKQEACYGFLKGCFAAPRKTLLNNIRATRPEVGGPLLEACGIPPSARPHDLTWQQYLGLWQALDS